MGKCLSCCEDPDDNIQSGCSQYSNGDAANERVESRGSGDHLVGRTGDSSDAGAPQSERHSSTRNSGKGGGGGTANLASSIVLSASSGVGAAPVEKRMFCSRIPPILSVGGEGKRAALGKECSEAKIVALYEQYRDPHEDAILSEGIEKLCQDLDVRPEEFRVLVLAWKFGAETMCKFTRQEFVNGCKTLKASSIKGIQAKFPEMLQEVQDPERFKDLYRFTFKFGLDSEAGQRILPADMAVGLWKLVFSQREPPLLARWLDFLEKHPSVRGVPRDTWNMFLNFLEAVGDDLSSYDDAEAWPSLFDDFVEYENDQTNQNVQQPKETKEESDRE